MKTILLTDGEFTGMIRTLRSLSEPVRILGFVSSENAAHTAFLDRSFVAPDWRDEGYLPFLLDTVKEEKVDYIFPIVTTSLLFMAENAEKIKAETGAVLITSPPEAIRIANNKALLFETLSQTELGDYITPFRTAKTFGELRKAVNFFEAEGSECISKPVCGENAEGFLHFVSERKFAERKLLGTAGGLIPLSSFDCFSEDACLPEERLIMPYLPGEEWDVDVLSKDGAVIAATVRKNLDMFGGLSACTVTVDRPDLFGCCREIVKKIGLTYLSCLSFKADSEGCPKLLEINPRAMGSIHLSTLAGNNLLEKLFSQTEPGEAVVTRPGFMASLYYDLAVVTDLPEPKTCDFSAAGTGIYWNEISPPMRETYEMYYNKVESRITDIVFNCRFAWDSLYHFRWAIVEDCFVQVSYGGQHSSPFLLMPLGDLTTEKLDKIVCAVREDFRKKSLPLTIYAIDENYLPLFEAMNIPHEPAAFSEDYSDYLYDAEALRTLSGRKYSKKRNHLAHFLKEHPDYVYESLNETHFEGCLSLIRKWAEDKDVDIHDVDSSDYPMIENMLTHWNRLSAKGGVILLDGRVAAFALGSLEGDTAYIHFEKADPEVDGLYVAINQMVLQNEFPDVTYVNREEDLGIPGLRHAKESYYPAAKVRKYKMKIQ